MCSALQLRNFSVELDKCLFSQFLVSWCPININTGEGFSSEASPNRETVHFDPHEILKSFSHSPVNTSPYPLDSGNTLHTYVSKCDLSVRLFGVLEVGPRAVHMLSKLSILGYILRI